MRSRLNRLVGEESGQTQTEYLMIVGLMAAVIVAVFVSIFWPGVKEALSTLMGNVKDGVTGTRIN